MRIRPAVRQDIAAVRRIAARAYTRYIPRLGRRPPPMDADFSRAVNDGTLVVCEHDHGVVAYMVASPRDRDYFIENLGVDPATQGSGLGRRLMAFAEDRARDLGLGRLTLYTHVLMRENLAFYGALGFTFEAYRNEAGVRRVYLEKRLDT